MTIRERIESLLLKQPPLTNEMVVWRGQSHNVIEPTSWFSTSHRDEVARSYGGSYLFKIHLQPGIHALDMYKYYAAANITNPYSEPNTIRAFLENNALIMSNNYVTFEEVIVQGGGQFWKDAAHTEKGFREIGAMRPTMWDFAEVDDPEWPDMIVYESYYSV